MKKGSLIVISVAAVLIAGSIPLFFLTRGQQKVSGTDKELSLKEYSRDAQPEREPSQMPGGPWDVLAVRGFQFPQQEIPAADFRLPGLEGGEFRLSDYEGEYLLLNFWATWCPPCKEEIPSLEALEQSLEGSSVRMLTISSGETAETVRGFVEEEGVSLPVALDTDGAVSAQYSLQSIPTTYLIDKEGNFIARLVGAVDWSEKELSDFLLQL